MRRAPRWNGEGGAERLEPSERRDRAPESRGGQSIGEAVSRHANPHRDRRHRAHRQLGGERISKHRHRASERQLGGQSGGGSGGEQVEHLGDLRIDRGSSTTRCSMLEDGRHSETDHAEERGEEQPGSWECKADERSECRAGTAQCRGRDAPQGDRARSVPSYLEPIQQVAFRGEDRSRHRDDDQDGQHRSEPEHGARSPPGGIGSTPTPGPRASNRRRSQPHRRARQRLPRHPLATSSTGT